MKLHEYQAKDILGKSGIPIPTGQLVTSSEQATKATQIISGPPWVIKAQVHAGGRGKGEVSRWSIIPMKWSQP